MAEMLHSTHHLLDVVQVAFLVTDSHSTILYANQQAEYLFGYKRSEIEGQRIRVLFLEDDLIYFLPNIIYLTLYQDGFRGELLLRQKDGRRIFVHLQTTSFKERGEIFMTFSFKEIQRLKALERERLASEHWASLGRMVEGIAHQVRNPIVAIGGFANRLLKIVSSSETGKSYLAKILKEAKRLETMVQRVEQYVQIPNLGIQKERVQEVVEEALQFFCREAKEKGISVNLDAGGFEEEKYFFVDRTQVVGSLTRILENCMDAIKRRRTQKREAIVKVAIFEDEENMGISISDKGEGIRKKNLGHIFEPFFSTRPDRIGLGLTFVKKVMERHGGRIEIESRWRRGTTFALYFPKDRRRRIRREFISPEAMEGEMVTKS